MVDHIVLSHGAVSDDGIVDRMARVNVKNNGERYFFYIFAEATVGALQEWRVTGRTAFMQGKIRMPTHDEIHWFDETPG